MLSQYSQTFENHKISGNILSDFSFQEYLRNVSAIKESPEKYHACIKRFLKSFFLEWTVFGFLSRDFTLREITLRSGIESAKISRSLFSAYLSPGTARYPIYPDAGDVCDAASVLCACNVAGNTDI